VVGFGEPVWLSAPARETTWLSAALLITRHIPTETPSLPSRLEPADRKAAPQILKDCRQAAGFAMRANPQVLARGDGFEVGVAS
jgi:hypothetical protein